MDIVFIPTLQHTVLVKVAIAVCEHPEIYPFTKINLEFDKGEENEQLFRDKVDKMLALPKLLQSTIFIFVKTLCSEIKSWRKNHYWILFSTINNIIKFCWRCDGTIDSSKTAESLVRNQNLRYEQKFLLACCYFLEKDVMDLKGKIWQGEGFYSTAKLFHSREVFDFWLPLINSGGSREFLAQLTPPELSDDTFLYRLFRGNMSCRCFLEKLPMDKCLDWLKIITEKRLWDRDLAQYIVSGSLRNQQIAIFSENAFQVLFNFLSWPLQSMFVDLAEHLWDSLSDEDFLNLLIHICSAIDNGQNDFDYSSLLKEFWTISPLSYKQYVRKKISNPEERVLFMNLLQLRKIISP